MNAIGTFANPPEPNYNFIKIIKYSALCSFAVCELEVSHRQIAKTKIVEFTDEATKAAWDADSTIDAMVQERRAYLQARKITQAFTTETT